MYQKQKMCDCCKSKPAQFMYKQYINGQLSTISLCKECNEMMNIEENYNVFLSSLFDDMFAPQFRVEEYKPVVCKCGCTEEDILSTGRFGCSECYKTFSHLVDAYVKKLGGKTYAGKMPAHVISQNIKVPTLDEKINELRMKMNDAAKKQDYVLAKKYQQELNALMSKRG